jgi:hypothetical protein
MLTRALHAGVPARWATGDEVYGNARVSQFWLIMFRLPPRLRERLGFLAGWPAQGMGREIWRR